MAPTETVEDLKRVSGGTSRRALLNAWYEHRLLAWFVAAYVVAGGAWLVARGDPWHLTHTYSLLWLVWSATSLLWIIWQHLRHPGRARQILTVQRTAGALLVIGVVAPFQSTFQSLKVAIPGFPWDEQLSRFDIALHTAPPWTLWLPDAGRLRVIDHVYSSWYVFVFLFVTWVSWTGRRYLRARALASTVLLWALGGTLLAWLFASAGPCYYHLVSDSPNPYTGLLERLSDVELFATNAQAALWRFKVEDTYSPFAGISAMPSMHVAMVVLAAMVLWRRSKPLGMVCWVYAAGIQIGSVVLGWHYAIDGYAGALLALGCWWGSRWLTPQHLREM